MAGARDRLIEEAPALPENNSTRWSAVAPHLVVAVVVLVLLWPLVAGETLFYRDLYRQHFGTANLIHSGGLSSGILWDPLLNGGQPLLANPNRFLLYPSRLLYLVASPTAGINWEVALHFLFGAMGASLLSRRLGVGPAGAAVTGLAFALGGLSVSLSNHLGRFLAYQWFGWIALAAHCGFADNGKRSVRWRMVLPVLLAVQWMTGAAELVAMSALLIGSWVVATTRAGASTLRRMSWAGALIVLGCLMAAVQIMPAAEMVLRSGRTALGDSASLSTWSLHPVRTVEMGVPGFCGPVDVADPSSAYWGAGLVDFGFPYLVSLYCGASILLLAAVGWIGSRHDQRWRCLRWVLLCLTVLGVVVAWGRHLPLVASLLSAIPGLNFLRYPVKAMVLTSIPLAVLAGWGVEVLQAGDRRLRRRVLKCSIGVAGLGLMASLALAGGLGRGALSMVFGDGARLAAEGLPTALVHTAVAVLGVAVAVSAMSRASTRLGAIMMIGVVAADLLAAAAAALPMGPAPAFATPPPLAKEIARHLDGRFVRDRDQERLQLPLPANRAWAPAAWWFSIVDGAQGANWSLPMVYHSDAEILAARRMAVLAKTVWTLEWEQRLNLFKLAGVDLLMTPERPEIDGLEPVAVVPTATPSLSYVLFRVKPSVPPAWWVADVVMAPSKQQALELILRPEFDPAGSVIREHSVHDVRLNEFGMFRPRKALLDSTVDAATDGMLVTTTPWHPDLVFEVDGRMVAAERLNYAFSGTPVAAGRHRVRLIFAPRSVGWGAAATLAAWFVWIAVFALWCVRPHSAPRG